MDGVRDIGGTDKLHAGIIGGIQMSKAVLWYDGTLKADTFRFPQALLQIRYTAHFAAKADFTDGNELIALTGQSKSEDTMLRQTARSQAVSRRVMPLTMLIYTSRLPKK